MTAAAGPTRESGLPPLGWTNARRERLELGALACVGGCLSVLAAVITIAGSTSRYDWLEAAARALSVGAPMAVGLYARQRPPFERFGMLLIVAGPAWFVTTLADSRDPLLYSTGRVAGWIVEAWFVYLVLAFPLGEVRGRLDRGLVYFAALLVLVLYLPTALLVESYAVPAPWTTCHSGCPENAFMVVGSEPAWIEDVVRPVREILTAALFGAVAVRLGQRLGGSSRLMRRVLAPVLVVAAIRLVAYVGALLGRRVWPESDLLEASVWLIALATPMLAGAFLAGLASWRLFIARAMQRLAARLRDHPGPEDLRAALADAFDDPTLEIVYWLGDEDAGWGDEEGHAIASPSPDSGRCLTEVYDGGQPVAAIIHDSALRDDHAFVDSATSYAVMTLDNHRLSAQASSLLREVKQSRARIQRSADDERRRIERDLHDGAQQRLVALRINLELAAERLGGDANAELLRGLGSEVDRSLNEVRSLARGIYPSPLADRGLVEALRSAALQAALPTTVLAAGVSDRYPRDIESAAYFCCLEALQNVAKHAHGATGAVIELSHDGVLRCEVRDDGAGFDTLSISTGVGMTSMRDRLAAVGGELAVVSSPGHGTRVIGTIPLADRPDESNGNGRLRPQ
jgi:signal transduction histidine kinase